MSEEVREAMVRTAGGLTRYLRAGEGPPALLIRSGPVNGPDAADPVLELLAATHRVFSLVLPMGAGSGSSGRHPDVLESWLSDVVEGLGLDLPELYLEASLASLQDWISQRFDGVVGKILILPSNSAMAD